MPGVSKIGLILMLVVLGLLPARADAAPVIAAASAVSSWFTATFGATIGGALLKLGGSVLLNAAASAIMGRRQQGSQQDLIRDLQQPTSLPVYRYVYGKCWAPGTPAPVRVIGDTIYACYILNSRPSAGPFAVYLDKRLVAVSGNPYDFAGAGAVATNEPFAGHCSYWIGRGDQIAPPAQILAEAGSIFRASDGWRGLTVIWLRLVAGDNEQRQQRWPSTPPEVMVDGRWSLLRDPRRPAAAPAWSANQALAVLDALRSNPLRPYDDRNLRLDDFAWAADVADAPLPTKSGVSIPRFEVNGVLAFAPGRELEDQVGPLVNAGASRLLRVGGQLGIVPAIWQPPAVTISDVLDDRPLAFERYRASGDLATEVSATYTAPLRYYETATTPAHVLPGAAAEDGGAVRPVSYDLSLVTDHRQCQYVAAIMGRRTRMQRSISAVLPGHAFDLVAGATLRLDLPAPYAARSGVYEVESIHPGFDPIGLSGVALRCPVTLREISASIYDWDPARDEGEVTIEGFDPTIGAVKPPGAVSVISDASTVLVSGDLALARVLFAAPPSASASVIGYEWQHRQGADLWQTGGVIDGRARDAQNRVFGYLSPVVVGASYQVRLRAVAPGGASTWVESPQIVASAGACLAPPPVPVSAIGGSRQIAVTFRAPNSADFRALEILRATTSNPAAAVVLGSPQYAAANASVTVIDAGLPASATYHYFARSIGRHGARSPLSGAVTATTT
ncbi:phage tail protein [Paracoccus sp. p3-h83]|uniref:phage tail protein n=1 Tax=Paracoccus sp. p3-h83 TaxID=3342805 RepID=UPI0035B7E915